MVSCPHIGIIYFEASRLASMCGHDTIGATVALIEGGLIGSKRADYNNQN